MVKSRKAVKEYVEVQKKRAVKRNIEGFKGIIRELGKVYDDYKNKEVAEAEARTLTYILRTMALTERDRYMDDIERRLASLESITGFVKRTEAKEEYEN